MDLYTIYIVSLSLSWIYAAPITINSTEAAPNNRNAQLQISKKYHPADLPLNSTECCVEETVIAYTDDNNNNGANPGSYIGTSVSVTFNGPVEINFDVSNSWVQGNIEKPLHPQKLVEQVMNAYTDSSLSNPKNESNLRFLDPSHLVRHGDKNTKLPVGVKPSTDRTTQNAATQTLFVSPINKVNAPVVPQTLFVSPISNVNATVVPQTLFVSPISNVNATVVPQALFMSPVKIVSTTEVPQNVFVSPVKMANATTANTLQQPSVPPKAVPFVTPILSQINARYRVTNVMEKNNGTATMKDGTLVVSEIVPMNLTEDLFRNGDANIASNGTTKDNMAELMLNVLSSQLTTVINKRSTMESENVDLETAEDSNPFIPISTGRNPNSQESIGLSSQSTNGPTNSFSSNQPTNLDVLINLNSELTQILNSLKSDLVIPTLSSHMNFEQNQINVNRDSLFNLNSANFGLPLEGDVVFYDRSISAAIALPVSEYVNFRTNLNNVERDSNFRENLANFQLPNDKTDHFGRFNSLNNNFGSSNQFRINSNFDNSQPINTFGLNSPNNFDSSTQFNQPINTNNFDNSNRFGQPNTNFAKPINTFAFNSPNNLENSTRFNIPINSLGDTNNFDNTNRFGSPINTFDTTFNSPSNFDNSKPINSFSFSPQNNLQNSTQFNPPINSFSNTNNFDNSNRFGSPINTFDTKFNSPSNFDNSKPINTFSFSPQNNLETSTQFNQPSSSFGNTNNFDTSNRFGSPINTFDTTFNSPNTFNTNSDNSKPINTQFSPSTNSFGSTNNFDTSNRFGSPINTFDTTTTINPQFSPSTNSFGSTNNFDNSNRFGSPIDKTNNNFNTNFDSSRPSNKFGSTNFDNSNQFIPMERSINLNTNTNFASSQLDKPINSFNSPDKFGQPTANNLSQFSTIDLSTNTGGNINNDIKLLNLPVEVLDAFASSKFNTDLQIPEKDQTEFRVKNIDRDNLYKYSEDSQLFKDNTNEQPNGDLKLGSLPMAVLENFKLANNLNSDLQLPSQTQKEFLVNLRNINRDSVFNDNVANVQLPQTQLGLNLSPSNDFNSSGFDVNNNGSKPAPPVSSFNGLRDNLKQRESNERSSKNLNIFDSNINLDGLSNDADRFSFSSGNSVKESSALNQDAVPQFTSIADIPLETQPIFDTNSRVLTDSFGAVVKKV